MTFKRAVLISLTAVLLATAPVLFAGDGPMVVKNYADLVWKDMGNGVASATVSGDMDKGPSRFFLKYPVGMVTPRHHHDAAHYTTLVSGTITLTVDGKAHRLGPGSYFASTNRAPHVAKVEGGEPVVFFIQSDGPWNVVMHK